MIDTKFCVTTEDKKYVKDMRSNAFLNIDKEGYNTFLQDRSRFLRQQHLEKQVLNMQQDMEDIKQLLRQLINGNINGKSNI